jgi:hypothetical protein
MRRPMKQSFPILLQPFAMRMLLGHMEKWDWCSTAAIYFVKGREDMPKMPRPEKVIMS